VVLFACSLFFGGMIFDRWISVKSVPAVSARRVIAEIGIKFNGTGFERDMAIGQQAERWEVFADGSMRIQFGFAVDPQALRVRQAGDLVPLEIIERGNNAVRFKMPPNAKSGHFLVEAD